MSPRKQYDQELISLRNDIEEMGVQVQNGLIQLFSAYDKEDIATVQKFSVENRELRSSEEKIEKRCLDLITRQQPVARDLRQVTATLKAIYDISRVGVQIAEIGQLLLRFKKEELGCISGHFCELIAETQKQLSVAVSAFSNQDMILAKDAVEFDDRVDELFVKIKNDIIIHLTQNSRDSDLCVDALMIDKYLEKIGDHAVNIAQWTIFQQTGEYDNMKLL